LDQLRTQAAFDMGCAADQLSFTELGGMPLGVDGLTSVQGVSGCGRRASYVYQARSNGWIKNSSEVGAGAAASSSVAGTTP
jgi:hypothetical protein